MNDYWSDWAQNRRIREAEESIVALSASAARERRRLTAELERQSGSLQQQLDALRRAFIAFVEYEDVRGELGQHADAAAVRRYAREVVSATLMGGRPFGVAEPPDVPGYWLLPAARAVLLASDEPSDGFAEQLADAQRRDPRRAALLVTLVEAIRREPRHSPALLDTLLPRQAEVTRADRVLWQGVAELRLGDEPRTRLVRALRARVEGLAPETVLEQLSADTDERGDPLPSEVAARRLDTLRRWVTGARAAVTTTGTPTGTTTAATTDTAQPGHRDDPEDPLADCLQLLVDEGAPGESDILLRMRDARARMGGLTPQVDQERRWDDPVGEVVDLVFADLREGPPALRQVALAVLAPELERAGRDLLAEAALVPATETTLPVRTGGSLHVTLAGVTQPHWREDAHAQAFAAVEVPAWQRTAAAVALGVGVLGLALTFLAGAFFLLALAGLGIGVGLGISDRRLRQTRERHVTSSVGYVERQVEQTVRRLTDHRDRSAAAHASAVEHEAQVRGALRGVPASAAPDATANQPAARPSTT